MNEDGVEAQGSFLFVAFTGRMVVPRRTIVCASLYIFNSDRIDPLITHGIRDMLRLS